MRSPTDASPMFSRTCTHGSGPMWIATPSSQWTCTTYSLPVSTGAPEFKARVAMAALSGEKTLAELSVEFGVHPTMISSWKQELVKRAGELFARGNKAPAVEDAQKVIDDLHRKIGQLQVERDFLAGQPAISRLLRGGR